MHQHGWPLGMDEIWTDEYKDPVHVVLQSLNQGFVVALCFIPIKSPESIGTPLKVTNHAGFLARIIGIGATATLQLARVVKCQHFFFTTATMALGPAYLDYGPLHVGREFPLQIDLHRLAHLQLVRQPLFRGSLALGIAVRKIIGRTTRL